ncbi:lysM and putative peptidoglycan-binding domain-containing protein 2 isoform X1 [Chiloscyllium plagiosum]|uniref:lysM and putative peptidoglycan-binding domain-containing protein 2 isoform X1 n=1 Tax=Chiloscyllium plagiosum TaxID=36176 RepID=UPI001CB7F0AB|nr:lysM and putative peptidoglycan-binding domain-containing protein 2 isoform X1 [Chiloscyllium plagiosum]
MSEPLPPGAGGGDESEAELSQSLARTKTRSYGSTASVAAPLAEKYIQHPVSPSDTLRGLALRYGVTMEQIKRANKLFTSDCIFLRKTLLIPVISDKGLLFNGLNSLESPENESYTLCEERPLNIEEESSTSPSPEDIENRPIHPEELSAKDFLQRLDLQIKLSTQAATKTIQEDDNGTGDAAYKDYSYAESSYQSRH